MRAMFRFVLVAMLFFAPLAVAKECGKTLQTKNVVFVMMDGVRWQEVFRGAEEALFVKPNGEMDEKSKTRYWADTAEARRELLMPFFWGVVAKQGQVIGNQDTGSAARVANDLNFSYPGYSETLCGWADPRVNSNRKILNPNLNVLEWLNGQPRLKGRVAAFGAWELFPYILNHERSGLFINAGYDPVQGIRMTPTFEVLNRLKAETTRYWAGEPFDCLTFETAVEYLKNEKPRVLFLSLGETDEWAHGGDYPRYLGSLQLADRYVKTLWERLQSTPRYKNKTTLILATDHGRGNGPQWRSHGENLAGSDATWMAFMGPDTPARGEWASAEPVTAGQLAATAAAFMGYDYRSGEPKAMLPVPGVMDTACAVCK